MLILGHPDAVALGLRRTGREPLLVVRRARHDFRGPNSKLVKSKPSMCTRCNNVRSQPFDAAWDRFGSYLVDHEAEILARRSLDLQSVFGADWRPRAADVERYVVKHLICRIVDQLPRPICLDPELLEFLDGGAYPSVLELDLCIDLGVVEMLRVARAAPPPEEPEAADAGFARHLRGLLRAGLSYGPQPRGLG